MDTFTLKLKQEQASNVEFLTEIPPLLKNVSSHQYSNNRVVTGQLENLKVIINEHGLKITNSLTKYLFGENISEMLRADIKRAFEKLSDSLHLPISQGEIIRFDYAKNIVLNDDIACYLPHLGDNGRYGRYEQKRGLNYKINDREISIYDKIAEMKSNRETIPPLYKYSNVMRIEKRYKNNVAKYFNTHILTGADLYKEDFYIEVVNDWYNDYKKIRKLNMERIDFSNVKTKKQYADLGIIALIEKQGGEIAAITNIKDRLKKGELTRKQAHDQRKIVLDKSGLKIGMVDNKLMTELNEKVDEAVKSYR